MKLRSSRRSYLPEDLMIDIIRRLSVEDLLRFRSVNKSWYRFISSTSFIKSTISNTNINHDSYLLCTYSDYYTLSNFSQGDEDDFTDNINKPKYYYITQLFGIDKPESPHLYTHEFGYNNFCSFAVEPRGESIALIRNIRGHLIKWVLRNCAVTDMFIWEKVVTLKLETPHIFPLGFTKHGKYLLRIDYNLDDKYLWDFGTSPLEVCTFDTGIKDRFAMAIDSLFGNLVLLDEKTLDPFVETEPCSTQHTCVLYRYPYKLPSPRNKKSTNLLVTTQYRMHGRGTQTAMEKPRKRGGKEMLNNKRNQLRERGTKRRKQGTEMEKPRKKKRKETFDRTKNVLQGRRKRRRMEETEMGNQRKKGRKEMMYKAQTILQGWGAKRRRDQTQNKLQGKRTTMNI
ncbi:hypothetical protein POM88_004813 [Heracleum sosnowskyi]|uniref:F-box domain-containing protein n=1 Tax=Heracleum sosnowskyi TaxID=360622 RepID=A0AAD8JL17_9APIA|nr:hypothetical protein POM88_004809 [Heracleum sosnowskyi]KAK1405208.1 hypothetical protein POM88_004813 [Heracleum sosnowskyi]